MTDREMLLVMYGAVKAIGPNKVVQVIEDYLFGDKPQPPLSVFIEGATPKMAEKPLVQEGHLNTTT